MQEEVGSCHSLHLEYVLEIYCWLRSLRKNNISCYILFHNNQSAMLLQQLTSKRGRAKLEGTQRALKQAVEKGDDLGNKLNNLLSF